MILSPLSDQFAEDEVEAMKSQFASLHRRTLDRQTSNQYILRSPSAKAKQALIDANVSANSIENDYDHDEDEKYGGETAKKRISFSDGVKSKDDDPADEKTTMIDDKDVAAMKADFNKQQKKLLQSQMSRSFRLRSISIDMEEDKPETLKQETPQDMDHETEEKLMEDSEEMKMQFQELNRTMIRMRSTKTLEMGMTPQIKPQHREQFMILLRDIGIVNEHIMDQLWDHIEKTVHQDDEAMGINQDEEEDEDEFSLSLSDIDEADEDIKAPEPMDAHEYEYADGAMQRCTQMIEDLIKERAKFQENCSVSNIDKIGALNANELVAGNSMFHTKLYEFNEIMTDIKGCCVGFIESMEEVEQYIAGKYIPNVAQYEEWDLNDICLWIKSLERGRFVQYIDALSEGFKKSNITNGSLLCDLETADLGAQPFQITNFRDKRD
eukprot:66271_1